MRTAPNAPGYGGKADDEEDHSQGDTDEYPPRESAEVDGVHSYRHGVGGFRHGPFQIICWEIKF